MTYESTSIGKYCIVRAHDAGVHAGVVCAVSGRTVVLEQARRLWRWRGAFTLSELSVHGIDHDESRIAVQVPSIEILDACEIIPCSDAAEASIRATPNG